MELGLKGKCVLVTGASKRRAIAELFAGEGANVAICSRNEATMALLVRDQKYRTGPPPIAAEEQLRVEYRRLAVQ